MRDNVPFIVREGTPGLPVGNFAGYIDHEIDFSLDRSLPFPGVRASVRVARCVMRIERTHRPDVFAADDSSNIKDIEITALVTSGTIRHDQTLIPDALKAKISH